MGHRLLYSKVFSYRLTRMNKMPGKLVLMKGEEDQAMTHWGDAVYFPELLAQLTELDQRLGQLHDALSDRTIPPDLLLDDIDDVIGEGFHRCQRYMRRRIGPNPSLGPDPRFPKGLRCGPKLGTRYVAEAIWEGANYWKHDGEWPLDVERLTPRQQRTLCLFRDLGITDNEYILIRLLEMLAPKGLGLLFLTQLLMLWRAAYDEEKIELTRSQPKRTGRQRERRAHRGSVGASVPRQTHAAPSACGMKPRRP